MFIHMYVRNYVQCTYVHMYVYVSILQSHTVTHITLQANYQPIHMAAVTEKVDILKYLGKLSGVDVHARIEVHL